MKAARLGPTRRQSPIRLYRHRARELKHLPRDFFCTAAFVDPSDPEVTVIITLNSVDKVPLDFYHVINHENLHTVFHRLGFSDAFNRAFDTFVNARVNRCVRRQDEEVLLVEVGL